MVFLYYMDFRFSAVSPVDFHRAPFHNCKVHLRSMNALLMQQDDIH